ncbi:amidohydrolase family protein [Gimesia algae]|uniref:Amidohydrolase n=1 Tax=Gimesia algae TaxID=2527971 RepID=A0A517VAK8_9PLAN|nr:amidohydrolase family protein [Gimesia algae]QDT90043.1 Amidohydrolase [Gimesia algae]
MNSPDCEFNRREFLTIASAVSLTASVRIKSTLSAENQPPVLKIIDTNVSLFQWPFRRVPLDGTQTLVKKLQALGIEQAWAGSYEGILHRDITSVNQRLTDECRDFPQLTPIGTINPSLPGWEHDLQQCIQKHQIPGIRLHPNYHGYTLTDPRLLALLKQATTAGLFVQLAASLEDIRTQHQSLQVPDVDLTPLPDLAAKVPGLRLQLLNTKARPDLINKLSQAPGIFFDTARVESTDGVPSFVERLPAGRVLFGSHAPFLIPEAALVRVYESSILDSADLRSVLTDNATQFLSASKPNQDSAVKIKVKTQDSKKTTPPRLAAGLPGNEVLEGYRIWDSYFTPAHSHPGRDGSSSLIAEIERAMPAINIGKFEKLCYFPHVGIGTTTDRELEQKLKSHPEIIEKPLKRWPDLLLGMIQLNANNVTASLEALNRWLQDGPMRGVYFPGGGPAALTCTHRNFDPLIERIAELNGVIMQHTWFITGGKKSPGMSTPTELAVLAKRFPQQKFICAHSGGEWERGIRAVRDSENILVETSGFDPTAGFIEMAVRELGANRIIFGSHLPSRSLGTELCKVTAAQISEADKSLILGTNFRQLLTAETD